MRISELAGRRVAVWGGGREGRAAIACLRQHAPPAELTLLDEGAADPAADAALAGEGVRVVRGSDALRALDACEVVVRSPGVSLYREEITRARARGVAFTSGTALWFADAAGVDTVAITGSKGKSTTSHLTAALLRAVRPDVELAGNMGVALLAQYPPRPGVTYVVELSSYQTAEFAGPATVGVVLNLYPEHLDWHGGVERYFADKLRLVEDGHARTAVLNARDANTAAHVRRRDGVLWFESPDGFHVEGEHLCHCGTRVVAEPEMRLRGVHNLRNAAAALTVVDALGHPWRDALDALKSVGPLRHRLTPLGERDGVLCVDDSISTIPQSAIAALDAWRGRRVTLLVGGHDRGLDYAPLAAHLRERPDVAVVGMSASGPRIVEQVRAALAGTPDAGTRVVETAHDLPEAVAIARRVTPAGGVILLSPAAPSYGEFRNFEERGDAFAKLCGFAPAEG